MCTFTFLLDSFVNLQFRPRMSIRLSGLFICKPNRPLLTWTREEARYGTVDARGRSFICGTFHNKNLSDDPRVNRPSAVNGKQNKRPAFLPQFDYNYFSNNNRSICSSASSADFSSDFRWPSVNFRHKLNLSPVERDLHGISYAVEAQESPAKGWGWGDQEEVVVGVVSAVLLYKQFVGHQIAESNIFYTECGNNFIFRVELKLRLWWRAKEAGTVLSECSDNVVA